MNERKVLQHKLFGRHYLMRFFTYSHLPPELQKISSPFFDLAEILDEELPTNMEKTGALRRLLESKDCAIRAHVFDVVK